jgi:hypothetical protein
MAKEGEGEDCPGAHLVDTTGLAARIALAAAQPVLQIDDPVYAAEAVTRGFHLYPAQRWTVEPSQFMGYMAAPIR